jgi:hypothetical protein
VRKLEGRLSRRTMSKQNDAIKCSARYLLGKSTPRTAAECFEHMTFKSGKLYRVSARATTLRRLESRMARHPILTKYDTKPRTYSCTLEDYEEYFDCDPFYDYTDQTVKNKQSHDKPSRRQNNG